MERYLDPKADLTFKKVFGEHSDLLISFLNALLPIEDDEKVVSLEYLPAELVPENPLKKNSIVDVRCKDQRGRQFIVEMQMIWSDEFKSRVLFNASKAYVRQLDSAENYKLLQPVYSLNLVNGVFETDMPDTFYHHYQMVHSENSDKVIDGLQLVFVELPKFVPRSIDEKKMRVLWLRFLTEVGGRKRDVSADLVSDEHIGKALSLVKESAYDDAQLLGYDKFWDVVRTEKTLYEAAQRKGLEQGLAEGFAEGIEKGIAQGLERGLEQGIAQGMEQGMAQGMAQGRAEANVESARKLKALSVPIETIAKATGLSVDEIMSL